MADDCNDVASNIISIRESNVVKAEPEVNISENPASQVADANFKIDGESDTYMISLPSIEISGKKIINKFNKIKKKRQVSPELKVQQFN